MSKAYIKIFFVNSRRPVTLHLPDNYTSDQWLEQVAETIADAAEVDRVEYEAKS